MRDFSASFYRGNLKSENAKLYYDRMLQWLEKEPGTFKHTFPLLGKNAMDDAMAAMRALREDRPEFFFLGESEYSACRDLTVTIKTRYTAKDVREIESLRKAKIRTLTAGLGGMSALRKEQTVYKRIIEMIRYVDSGSRDQYNIVGPLRYGRAVCAGIAAMVTLAFRAVGIPCITVSGVCRNGELHAWNLVWINGIPCHLDATNDVCASGNVPYFFFNLTDTEIRRSYRIKTAGLPRCVDDSVEYHRRQRTYFRDRSCAVRYLEEGLNRDLAVIRAKFAPGVDPQSCIDEAFRRARGYHGKYHYYISGAGDAVMVEKAA